MGGFVVHDLETLDLAVRAAASALGENEMVLVGSIGPLLAITPDAPIDLRTSQDIDLFPLGETGDYERADALIGPGSPFEKKNGFYVERLGLWTVMSTPDGWQERSRGLRFGNVTACALALEDTLWNKLEVGRAKEISYAEGVFANGIITRSSFTTSVAGAPPQKNPELFETSKSAVMAALELVKHR